MGDRNEQQHQQHRQAFPCPVLIWKLPDTVLFHILTYVAPPTHRAAVICHQLALLSRDAANTLLRDAAAAPSIWDIILRQDYHVQREQHEDTVDNDPGEKARKNRRTCKRLRRSVIQQVQGAHQMIRDNTEIAFFYLTEMANRPGGLTKAKLRGLWHEYGPLRVNTVVSSGGVFLVEVCRAKQVRERTLLACVQELVEHYGAGVDVMSHESPSSQQTALCVATVRGMPTIVQYLLRKGADPELRSSGRFRLTRGGGKSVRCQCVTPLEFGRAMREAEAQASATKQELKLLDACLDLLRPGTRKRPPA